MLEYIVVRRDENIQDVGLPWNGSINKFIPKKKVFNAQGNDTIKKGTMCVMRRTLYQALRVFVFGVSCTHMNRCFVWSSPSPGLWSLCCNRVQKEACTS